MASPQVENGHIKIANELWDALVKYRLPGEQMQCLMVILRQTYGWNKKIDAIALSQFVEKTGLAKSSVIRALKGLQDKQIITVYKNVNAVYKNVNAIASTYQINKDFQNWKPVYKKVTVYKKVNERLQKSKSSFTKMYPTKDTITKDTITKDKLHYVGQDEGVPEKGNDQIPYQEIISYLNQKTGTQFKHTTKPTQRHIQARWNEGFRLEDFHTVIDVKVSKWLHDPKMSDFLRPETLFGTKFEAYLNEAKSLTSNLRGVMSDTGIKNLEVMNSWLQKEQQKESVS